MPSSRGFDAFTLELPRRPLGDRLSVAVVGLAALVALGLADREPVLAAVVVGVCLGLLAWVASGWRRPRVVRLEFLPDGTVAIVDGSGRRRPQLPGPATRILGPTLQLDLGEAGRPWLTPIDVPGPALRRAAAWLAVSRQSAES